MVYLYIYDDYLHYFLQIFHSKKKTTVTDEHHHVFFFFTPLRIWPYI